MISVCRPTPFRTPRIAAKPAGAYPPANRTMPNRRPQIGPNYAILPGEKLLMVSPHSANKAAQPERIGGFHEEQAKFLDFPMKSCSDLAIN